MQDIRAIFFVSDRTGLTAESYGKSLLAQFPDLRFETRTLAFVDSIPKAQTAKQQIEMVSANYSKEPIIFSTLVGKDEQDIIEQCHGHVISLFGAFLEPLEKTFGMESAHSLGQSNNIWGNNSYQQRLDAIDYALMHDDGVRPDQYDKADVILVGVSRCGKTPTSLYLAMNLSLKSCNYPLTEEDMQYDSLPEVLLKHKHKLVALTIKPVPLSKIRKNRRPNSQYASLPVCQKEVIIAERMFKQANLSVFDTTETSIEEIASKVVQALALSKERSGIV